MENNVNKERYYIKFHGISTEAIDYKGIQIIYNSLNNGWMLFFDENGKYASESPFAGTLTQMKKIIDDAIDIEKGGERYLIKENTYRET
jgi:hypothetical protein